MDSAVPPDQSPLLTRSSEVLLTTVPPDRCAKLPSSARAAARTPECAARGATLG
jgi:hypothetical protein